MKTKDRLAHELAKAEAPMEMVEAAIRGEYDDYESQSATPTTDLYLACQRAGMKEFAQRVMDDEFSGTKEESQEWFDREGQYLLRED